MLEPPLTAFEAPAGLSKVSLPRPVQTGRKGFMPAYISSPMENVMSFKLTRRALMQHASGAGLATFGTGLIVLADTTAAKAAVSFEAYHGVTAAVHQENFNRLSQKKFRPISLSVYGDAPNVLYAAVWVDRPGPAFAMVHGLNAQDYQAAFDTWRAKGYAPTILAATGSADHPVFAAVFEQGVQGAWRSRHGMTAAEFTSETGQAASAQQKLRWASIYGSPNDPRYIATWHANPGWAKWHVVGHVKASDYQGVFETQTQIPGFRPACVSVASDHSVCALFTDEGIGPWSARHGMTPDEYQAEFSRQRSAGRMPICVQGGGSGGNVRYAAIFASQDQPLARQWSATGQRPANLAQVDDIMHAFMVKHAVRSAQLTIGHNGTVKLQRAYTWAEPGHHVVQISDRFLLASNSKMFVAAAIKKLIDMGKLQTSSHAYQVLGFSNPKDNRSDTITVQQLLDHNAGYTYDPTYDMRRIALAHGLNGPAGKRDIALEMYGRTLDYAPGMAPDPKGMIYNNYGYLLLSLVVEKVSGQDYFQFLRAQVLQPDGISEVDVYPTAAANRPANLIAAEDEGVGLSALAPHSNAQVPAVFGGDGMVKETAVGSCGLAASASAMAQFIHKHAAWGMGGRAASARSGSTPGTSTWAQSLASGTDWALVVNTREWAPGSGDAFGDLTKAINAEIGRVGV